MITVRDLSHAYHPSSKVLDDIGIDLPPGQVTALVGANGAGKSTLLSAIARLLTPTSGQVCLDGMDVATADPSQVAQRLAVLRQDNRIAARLSVIDLVRFGRFPYSRGRLRPEDHAIVEQCLEYVALGDLRDRFLDELSGGQRQRAFIAMVLAQDTEYVLLDEPLNNLDLVHSAATMQLLRRAADELGRTVVLVLHDINVAAAYGDRIVGMRDGRVVVDGPPEQVMTPPALADIFGMQIAVHEVHGTFVALHWSGHSAPSAPSAPTPVEWAL